MKSILCYFEFVINLVFKGTEQYVMIFVVVFSNTSTTLRDIEFRVASQYATISVKLTDINDVYKEQQIEVGVRYCLFMKKIINLLSSKK